MTDDSTLDWSDLILVGESTAPNYLFEGKSGRLEFVLIETEFNQLNDYCVLCLTQTLAKLNELRTELDTFETGKEHLVDPDFGDVTGDYVWSLSALEIPTWEENYSFIAKAMCLILLSFFTEKSLKSLCTSLAPSGRSPKRRRGESKIGAYVRFLKKECGFDLAEPREFIDVRENCRGIRNSFAHGDWDDIKTEVSGTELAKAFQTVANLLYIIESEAYPRDIA